MMQQRFLQDGDEGQGEEETTVKGWEALRTTLVLYGTIFGVFLTTFCLLRLRFPAVYNVRSRVARLHCALSENAFGRVSWTWRVLFVSEDEIFDQCGMDAVCLLRILRMGLRMSFMGIFCSAFLLPVYITAEGVDSVVDPETNQTIMIDDWILTTASNVPNGSDRYVATAVAAWVLFLYSMLVVWRECRWFSNIRAKYLSLREPQNYALHVSGIPAHCRSDQALADYFRRIFSNDAVVEAHVVVNLPKLNEKVKERSRTRLQWEHAQALRDVKGIEVPMHTVVRTERVLEGGRVLECVPAIEYFQQTHQTLQEDIRRLRAEVQERQREADEACLAEWKRVSQVTPGGGGAAAAAAAAISISKTQQQDDSRVQTSGMNHEEEKEEAFASAVMTVDDPDALDSSNATVQHSSGEKDVVSPRDDDDNEQHTEEVGEQVVLSVEESASQSQLACEAETDKEKDAKEDLSESNKEVALAASSITAAASTEPPEKEIVHEPTEEDHRSSGNDLLPTNLLSLVGLGSGREGGPLSSGFVIFHKLAVVSAARQIVHTADPAGMKVMEPPQPEAIIWANVAIPPSVRQTRQLTSFAIAATVCLFWTVPVTFLVTLTEPEWLKQNFPKIENVLENNPWLEGLLNQLGPLLIQLMNNVVLPDLMKLISRIEGVIGQSRLLASMMTKLASFLIVQTFLVASVSGSLFVFLDDLETVGDLFRFLATVLPSRFEFFIQILLISSTLVLGLELIRTTALIKALIRKCIGPRLTEKERSMPYLSCRPLNNPRIFLHAHVYAEQALHFIILFTFAVLAPLMCPVLSFTFLALEIGNRHQFFFIYGPKPDSGGRIWMELIVICLCCMPIAQLILLAYLGLRESSAAFWTLLPLIFVTILFALYIRFRYFPIFLNLPSDQCQKLDSRTEGDDFDFVKQKYRQPALADDDKDDEAFLDEAEDERTPKDEP